MVIEFAIAAVFGTIAGAALIATGAGVVTKKKVYNPAKSKSDNKKIASIYDKNAKTETNAQLGKKDIKKINKIYKKDRKILKRGRLTLHEQVECLGIGLEGDVFQPFISVDDLRKQKSAKKILLAKLKKRKLTLKKFGANYSSSNSSETGRIKHLSNKIEKLSNKKGDLFKNGFFRSLEKSDPNKTTYYSRSRMCGPVMDPINKIYCANQSTANLFVDSIKNVYTGNKSGEFSRFSIDYHGCSDLPIRFVSSDDKTYKFAKLAAISELAKVWLKSTEEERENLSVRIIDEAEVPFKERNKKLDDIVKVLTGKEIGKYIGNYLTSAKTKEVLKELHDMDDKCLTNYTEIISNNFGASCANNNSEKIDNSNLLTGSQNF